MQHSHCMAQLFCWLGCPYDTQSPRLHGPPGRRGSPHCSPHNRAGYTAHPLTCFHPHCHSKLDWSLMPEDEGSLACDCCSCSKASAAIRLYSEGQSCLFVKSGSSASRKSCVACTGVALVHKHRDSAYGLTVVWALVSYHKITSLSLLLLISAFEPGICPIFHRWRVEIRSICVHDMRKHMIKISAISIKSQTCQTLFWFPAVTRTSA